MKVILLEKVANLGNLGDIAEVKNGFARNFLIPFNKAKRATEASLKEFEAKRSEYEKNQSDVFASAQNRQSKIDGQVFAIAAKAGVDGKLFGSVTSFDIVDAVNKSGVEIKRSEVSMPNGPLKTIGEFDITILLHHEVQAVVKINVTPEQ
ncbi:MAG: ribosomal protein [Burkholderiales bacterium]|jgi:large subunit ribosomal protein L9|nr:ribosomal protein [Burkholderiales bacterium]MCE3268228.1 ribosomal protein [Burkholderiales bacterium]